MTQLALHELMPSWVAWLSAGLAILSSAMVPAFVVPLAIRWARPPLTKVPEAPWHERARALWSARIVSTVLLMLMPVLGIVCGVVCVRGLGSPWSELIYALTAATAFSVTLPWHLRLERFAFRQPIVLGTWARGAVSLAFTMFPVFMLLPPLLLTAPESIDAWFWIWLVVGLSTFGVAGAGYFLEAAIWLRLARPAPQRVSDLVGALTERTGRKMPRVVELPWRMANAVAWPLRGIIGFTTTAIRELSDQELTAIATHELGHLEESRWERVFRLLQSYSWFPLAAAPLILSLGGVGALALVWVFVIALSQVLRRAAIHLEKKADRYGHRHTDDPAAYALALERLHELSLIPAVVRAPGQPHLYDRMLDAGVTPAYPRPKAPRGPFVVLFCVIFFSALGTPLGLGFVERIGNRYTLFGEHDVPLLLGTGARDARKVAEFLVGRGDFEAAARAYELAADSDETDSQSAALAAIFYAHAGRCTEAGRNAARSERRAQRCEGVPSLTRKALEAARECRNP